DPVPGPDDVAGKAWSRVMVVIRPHRQGGEGGAEDGNGSDEGGVKTWRHGRPPFWRARAQGANSMRRRGSTTSVDPPWLDRRRAGPAHQNSDARYRRVRWVSGEI